MAKLLALVIGYALSSFFLKLFTTIGIGVFTYKGLLALINQMLDLIQPLFNQLPAGILSILAIAGVPEALSILASAFLTRAAINAAKAWVGVIT